MDLTTGYMGLTLPSPLVASASPLTGNLDNLVALQRHGAGAVVLPSIFEEQIRRDGEIMDLLIDRGAESFGEALSYFPSQTAQRFDTVAQMDLVEQASQALDIPVIASLNGTTDSGWVDYAVELEARGAAAIELNVYLIPSDIALTGAQVEDRYCAIVSAVSKAVSIPVSVKIGPYFSAPGQMAGKLVQAGAKGLVLFNRFYQPDIDLSTLTLSASLELSNPDEMRLPLLWIGVLSGRIDAALAATTGVDSAEDAVKYLLAGADVVMTTSALLRYGVGHMAVLHAGLSQWLSARGLDSPGAMRGRLSHSRIDQPEAYERANYIRVLKEYTGD